MKNLISAADLSKKDILKIFKLIDKLKNKRKPLLKDKVLAMIFEKPSTRTRVSFETAMTHLGGHAIYLSKNDMQLGRGETISDTAKVLSRYVDGIMARLFSHGTMKELAKDSSIPVINGLDDHEHPVQALTDLYTIWKKKKSLKNLRIVFLGDGANNTFHSLIYLCEKFGMDIVVSCHHFYKPKISAKYKVMLKPREAVKGADILYVDTFVSMGQENEEERRLKDLAPYQLNSYLLSLAKKNCIVLHPMPMHRGREIAADVVDSKSSIIFEQAENRLHVQKAVLYTMLK